MTHTVVGIFDDQEDARNAMKDLINAGFAQKDVDFSRRGNAANTAAVKTAAEDESIGDQIGNFFSNLFTDQETVNNYTAVARETEAILTVLCDSDERAERAADILDNNGAVNVNERAAQYRQQNAETGNTESDMTIPVIEEDLTVGKRTVESGGVRVRSRVVEKPVKETLRLREEHIVVDRRPVNREATQADFDNLQEGDIELTERAERAVVGKEARVVEEIAIGKTVTEHEETVSDTVRKTQVDVDQVDTDINTRKANN